MAHAWKYIQTKRKFGGLVSKEFIFIDFDVATRFVTDELDTDKAYSGWDELELQKEAIEILHEGIIELIEEY